MPMVQLKEKKKMKFHITTQHIYKYMRKNLNIFIFVLVKREKIEELVNQEIGILIGIFEVRANVLGRIFIH